MFGGTAHESGLNLALAIQLPSNKEMPVVRRLNAGVDVRLPAISPGSVVVPHTDGLLVCGASNVCLRHDQGSDAPAVFGESTVHTHQGPTSLNRMIPYRVVVDSIATQKRNDIQSIPCEQSHLCRHCGELGATMRCTGCDSRPRYCNQNCQRQDRRRHKMQSYCGLPDQSIAPDLTSSPMILRTGDTFECM